MNNAPITLTDDDDDDYILENGKVKASLGVKLFEMNAKYDANNVYAVFEYGQNSFDVSNVNFGLLNNIEFTKDWQSSGYYLDLGYNIGNMVNCGKLIPWFRVSNVARNVDAVNSKNNSDFIRLGLTWWPINNIAFKLDYGKITTEATTNNESTEFNVGIGYNF
jgi:hypothetical protein